MITSFSTALSALNATATAIDVVGNNLANLNTTGYKESVVSFHDLVTQSVGGTGDSQVGFGVARPLTTRQFTQGGLQATSGEFDAAIQGDGFFVVKDASTGETLYTRSGDFKIDKDGNLLTGTGQHVQGLNSNGSTSDIRITADQRKATATSNISLNVNLNAGAAAGDKFSTPLQVIDSLGNPLLLTATFTKDATTPLKWNYQFTIPGDATTTGTAGTPTPLLTTPGSLTFDATGKLVSPAAPGTVALSVTGLADSAAPLNINLNLYDATGAPTFTQFSLPSATLANSQDGVAAAQLTGVGMADGGQVIARYSDGTKVMVAQLAMAAIRNPASLLAMGQNNYAAGVDTAEPAFGLAGTGGLGKIMGGSLESSTVDIAKEFTQLIVLQRAYQANGKVITAGDQISQDTIAMLR